MEKCEYAKKCSGCQLQNLTYEKQLQMKQVNLIRLLGSFCHVEEIIGMDEPFHYRNKLQSAFAWKNGKVISGIYQSSTKKITEIKDCMLEDKQSSNIVQGIKRLCSKYKIKPYDINTGKGFFRHVLVRKSFTTGEIMVVLVTAKGEFEKAVVLVSELVRCYPEITTVVWNINPTKTPLLLGDESVILYGSGYITDELCGLSFRISPRSFYQVNPKQTEILYKTAKKFAKLTGKETLIDAYCGTGTIGLFMADCVKSVIGVEVNGDAVLNAKENAEINGIANAKFYSFDAGLFMEQYVKAGNSVDIVITDPPRAGCSIQFLKSLFKLSPKRIVYISCNPETLERDLRLITKNGYKVKKIQPVDLFPYTSHVECVVMIEKRSLLQK